MRNGRIDLSTGKLVDVQDVGVIQKIISARKKEELNGNYTLEFEAVFTSEAEQYIDQNSSFRIYRENPYEWFNELFNISSFTKNVNDDNTVTISVEAEHISYSLNDSEWNVTDFISSGTPQSHLNDILAGTGYVAGVIGDFPDAPITIEYSGEMSRREILMDYVSLIGGELQFYSRLESDTNTFTNFIYIYEKRGSDGIKTVMPKRNIKVLSKTIDKRVLDSDGNPTISYECQPIGTSLYEFSIGDTILMIDPDININSQLRISGIESNPYDLLDIVISFGAIKNGIESSIRNFGASSLDGSYAGGIEDVPEGETVLQGRLPGQWQAIPKGIEDVPADEKNIQGRVNGEWLAISLPPPGGKTGQVLKKKSDNDGDFIWANDETSGLTQMTIQNMGFLSTPLTYQAMTLEADNDL
jgi:hypothetical protein